MDFTFHRFAPFDDKHRATKKNLCPPPRQHRSTPPPTPNTLRASVRYMARQEKQCLSTKLLNAAVHYRRPQKSLGLQYPTDVKHKPKKVMSFSGVCRGMPSRPRDVQNAPIVVVVGSGWGEEQKPVHCPLPPRSIFPVPMKAVCKVANKHTGPKLRNLKNEAPILQDTGRAQDCLQPYMRACVRACVCV